MCTKRKSARLHSVWLNPASAYNYISPCQFRSDYNIVNTWVTNQTWKTAVLVLVGKTKTSSDECAEPTENSGGLFNGKSGRLVGWLIPFDFHKLLTANLIRWGQWRDWHLPLPVRPPAPSLLLHIRCSLSWVMYCAILPAWIQMSLPFSPTPPHLFLSLSFD